MSTSTPARPRRITKQMVSIRLDIDVLCALRASGARWQTRLNAIVRDYVERLHRESPHER